MNCDEVEQYLDPFLDNQLRVTEILNVQEHLNICVYCRKELEIRQLMRSFLRSHFPWEEVPPHLRESILTRIDQEARLSSRSPLQVFLHSRKCLGIVLMMVSLMVIGGALWFHRETHEPFIVESVNRYIRYALSESPVELKFLGNDQIREWIESKIDFVAAVPDLGREGYHLRDIRLDRVLGKKAIEFLYEREGQKVLFVMVRSPDKQSLRAPKIDRNNRGFYADRLE
ncbi:MAG: zf-HC2 domain-containing protein, partial [Candidatus Tectomicrobia bacterium]|nr:zf-HC2 domain-containing protein [Candidatus Tectomicrobia bacterium]